MHLKIRSFVPCANDEKKSELLVIVSKLTVVSDLKTKISEEVDIDKGLLRLFYMGKELNDSYKIYDYGMKLNDVVQFMVNSSYKKNTENNKNILPNESNNIDEIKTNEENGVCDDNSSSIEATTESEKSRPDSESHVKAESKFYKVGDKIDAKDLEYGAWFEAIIVDICRLANADKTESTDLEEEKLIFKVKFERRMFLESLETSFQHIRPRSTTAIDFLELKVGDTVLVNYNIEEPDKRGFWYDLYIKRVSATKTKRILEGDIYVGTANTELENVQIKILDKVYKIEEPVLLTERDDIFDNKTELDTLRKERAFCEYCKDSDNKKCKECGCRVCGEKNEPEKMLVCDECEMAYHLKCLNPPLEKLPDDDEWFCPDCKTDVNEIVKIGDKLKTKKSKKTSVKNNSSDGSVKVRDWGHGMACVSRTKICTIVPPNHYGPIPGIEVGMCWNFRMQVSETGVHRPHVAGIHGRENDGAYSIVLSGGYEDDHDNGETFYYTGSGGRDLSGNKRTAQQSCDQTLTRMNKALALNCNTKLNVKGAEANNWKGGKPVRVVRNYKMGQYSKFAPEQGNRYDGIYKVIKYWPCKGKSGFIVWRYMLRRDDPEPAPWEKNAKKFDVLYPDGYLEAMKMEEEKKTLKKSTTEKQNQKFEESNVKKGKKRKGATLKESVTKKQNTGETLYEIPNDIKALIADDKKAGNVKCWEQCEAALLSGKIKFLSEIEEVFKCICCQELIFKPVTTECMHSFCQSCLSRSFAAKLTTCPHCRKTISNDNKINENLSSILMKLFPGYDANRS